MNLASIFALILSNPQAIQETVGGLVSMFKATTAPTTTVVPAISARLPLPPGSLTIPVVTIGSVTRKPSEAIRSLQALLNQLVKPQPPLKEDGWLGEKTEKAIQTGIAMAQPYIAMLG